MQPLPDRALKLPIARARLLAMDGAPTEAELRGPLWARPHRGVVAWAALDHDLPAQRISAAAAALPDVPLGGWAAAYVHGAKDLDGQGTDGKPLPVTFCPGPTGRRRRRKGLQPLRSRLDDADIETRRKVLVTSAARTAFDLARTATTLADAVADVDAMLRTKGPALDAATFGAYVESHPGFRGIDRVRAAARLVDADARSRPESRLRVIWLLDAGLPPPLVNREVISTRNGRVIGIPDLLDAATGLVAEYDGAHHRDEKQHTSDNAREEGFEQAGLTVVRFTALDLRRGSAHVAARLRAGLEQARRQQHREWRCAS